MDNPQPPPFPDSQSEPSVSAATTASESASTPAATPQPTKKEMLQGCGCLSAIVLIAVLCVLALFKSCSGEKEAANEGSTLTETSHQPSESSSYRDKWQEVPLETRKSLSEQKLREAEELKVELESLLQAANQGRLSVENIGQISSWENKIAIALREIDESGFESGAEYSSMACIKSAITQMQSAWDNFEKFIQATSSSDQQTFASIHSTQLKLMRDNLDYAHQWMEKGKY